MSRTDVDIFVQQLMRWLLHMVSLVLYTKHNVFNLVRTHINLIVTQLRYCGDAIPSNHGRPPTYGHPPDGQVMNSQRNICKDVHKACPCH